MKKVSNKNEESEVQNFDYQGKLTPILSKADKGNKNIVLLTTGAFNPVHRMHLEMLYFAYKYLLSFKKYNILCAFISPSADCYVAYKQPPLIHFNLRCEMIESSINNFYEENKEKNEEEMINIFLHKWEGSHSYFIDFPEVINEIQKQINHFFKNIKVLYVCGMDHFIKCSYCLRQNVIVVDRKPFKEDDKYPDDEKKYIFFVRDENSEPYSSTSIRDYYKDGDLEGIKKSTFPDTFKKIIEFYDNNKDKFENNY